MPLLLQRIAQIFPVSTIYTPFDQVHKAASQGVAMLYATKPPSSAYS